jgi:hypothetical protein
MNPPGYLAPIFDHRNSLESRAEPAQQATGVRADCFSQRGIDYPAENRNQTQIPKRARYFNDMGSRIHDRDGAVSV